MPRSGGDQRVSAVNPPLACETSSSTTRIRSRRGHKIDAVRTSDKRETTVRGATQLTAQQAATPRGRPHLDPQWSSLPPSGRAWNAWWTRRVHVSTGHHFWPTSWHGTSTVLTLFDTTSRSDAPRRDRRPRTDTAQHRYETLHSTSPPQPSLASSSREHRTLDSPLGVQRSCHRRDPRWGCPTPISDSGGFALGDVTTPVVP